MQSGRGQPFGASRTEDQWAAPQNAATTLYTRRHMQHEKRTASIADTRNEASSVATYRSSTSSLRIDTSPTLSSGRPAFHRRNSSLSGASTTASSPSEASTPTISPFSSTYTYTPGTTASTTLTGITTLPNSACTGILQSPFPNTDSWADGLPGYGRPALLRSVSEDVKHHRQGFTGISCTSQAGEGSQGEKTKDLGSLPMQGRAFTTNTLNGRQSHRNMKPIASAKIQGSALHLEIGNCREQSDLFCAGKEPAYTLEGRMQTGDDCTSTEGTGHLERPFREDLGVSTLTASSSISTSAISTATTSFPRSQLAASVPPRSCNTSPSRSSSLPPQHQDSDPSSNIFASFDRATAEAIRKAAALVRSSAGQEVAPIVGGDPGISGCLSPQSGLMGNCGNGYFANAIRSKVVDILQDLIPACPSLTCRDNLSIVEYGSLNSLSTALVTPITSQIRSIRRSQSGEIEDTHYPSFSVLHADLPGSDFRYLTRQLDNASSDESIFSSFATRKFAARVAPCRSVDIGYSLMDLHWQRRASSSTVGGASPAIAAHNELQSFLQTRAVEFRQGGVLVLAFLQRSGVEDLATTLSAVKGYRVPEEQKEVPGFTSPLRCARAAPSGSNSSIHSGTSPSSSTGFLNAFSPSSTTSSPTSSPDSPDSSNSCPAMLRCRSGSSPCIPSYKHDSTKKNDIWSSIPALLAPCIQRLVSTGLIKSDTAHHLLALPLHPRTPEQTQATLRSVRNLWQVEWSCGLLDQNLDNNPSPSTPTPSSTQLSSSHIQEEALHLAHPAYTAIQSSAISRVQFAEHALQFIRVLYETHFRNVLRDRAKLSRSRLEEVLDALNEVLREKIEEHNRPLLALEIECCIVALRKL